MQVAECSKIRTLLWACLLLLWAHGSSAGQVAVDARVDFARDIRPILADACFHCHGPDEAARQADLRLDTHAGLLADLGGYAAMVPGDPQASQLIERIESDDASIRMPPPESNKSLSSEARGLLRQWIAQGGSWQQHWSFVPPQPDLAASTPSSGAAANWCFNEIDSFIIAQQAAAGLRPSPEADPYTLVRRLYLDLIGLPPTPQEADQWIARIWPKASPSQVAHIHEGEYQALVSHLLASPQYGERWARKWLDLARYADTNGYEKDRDRTIWPYRDWVVDAINSDMPFDQFTVQQLAGDMLPGATQAQRVATGFHRNTMLNEEGGIDPLEFRYYAMTDRVATTGTTWLGLTLGCCQCHTHKYDPISHTEYFQLMALLNNADEPMLELPTGNLDLQWANNRKQARTLLDGLRDSWPVASPATTVQAAHASDQLPHSKSDASASDPVNAAAGAAQRAEALDAAFQQWLVQECAGTVPWWTPELLSARANLPILTLEEDGVIFASGDTAKRDDYWLSYSGGSEPITAIQLEALPDARLPAFGPGSTYYEGTLGDFYLVEFRLEIADVAVGIRSAEANYSKNRYGNNPATADLMIDGDVQTGWSVHQAQGRRHVAVFVLEQPIPAGEPFSIQMTFGRHFASSLGKFRIRVTSALARPHARVYSSELEALLRRPAGGSPNAEVIASTENAGPASAREAGASATNSDLADLDLTEFLAGLKDHERVQLMDEFLLSAPHFAEQASAIRELLDRPLQPTTLVMQERPEGYSRQTYRHHRGEYLQAAEPVTPAVPEVLPQLTPGDSLATAPNRLDFARWLVAEDNPLTARVVVNRHWAVFFGKGLVVTEDDFGLQGDPPTHPQLLDWLAYSFMHQDQWSFKELHRKMVSSRTYRQSSMVNLDSRGSDPANRLLSYMPRIRLDAEVLRDTLLAASGGMVDRLGGPPVRPPQPKGVTELAYGAPVWKASGGADRYRRSLYTYMKRTAPFAMFATFDGPSGESCIARRTPSNSPLQALTLMNDRMLLEFAALAAGRLVDVDSVIPKSESTALAVEQLFRSVMTRPPAQLELETLVSFYQQQAQSLTADQAKLLVESALPGVALAPETEPSLIRLAALTATARAIFALDETQTRN